MILSSGLGLALSLVFGCLLLVLLAELYYLLWRRNLRVIAHDPTAENDHANELFHLFRWTKPAKKTASADRNPDSGREPLDVELGSSKEFLLRALSGESDAAMVEAELTRIHNRFLFTIKEETKEDLESEDGRSRNRSLSDLILAVDSPLASPPLTARSSSYCVHGVNPLFESSSPPPKFKFLRDAEEKLYRKLLEEARRASNGGNQSWGREEEDGALVRVVVGKCNHHSSSAQVLPLASSPTSLTSSIGRKPTLL